MQHTLSNIIIYIFLFLCLCVSCTKDDGNVVLEMPNTYTEFCDMYMNTDKRAATITLDDGTMLDILSQDIRSNVADTTVRAVVTYALKNEKPVIYSNTMAFCDQARPKEQFKITPRDPMKIVSVWKGGKYINMVLGEMTNKAAKHSYGFLIEGVDSKILNVSFIHFRPSADPESYTEKKYFSMPLATSYVSGYDSIAISITTYDGVKSYSFAVN